MTSLLKKAFDEVARLEESEQDAVAQWLLEELDSERRWDRAFSASPDALKQLADDARDEHRAGRSKAIGPDEL